MPVYFADSYREVLQKRIAENAATRGYKTRIALAAGCHNSYLSQVLSGTVDLTPEQAINLANFWDLAPAATDFFIDLLQRDRAGSAKLRDFYEQRLKKARDSHDAEASSGRPPRSLSPDAQAMFFSSWFYAAVLALAITAEHSNEKRMALRLCLPLELVVEVLASLEDMGLLKRRGKGWILAGDAFHLPRGAALHATNQVNWRNRAIANIQNRDPESLHLLHVGGMLQKDIRSMKAKLVECFDGIRASAQGSPPDEGLAITIDLFRF